MLALSCVLFVNTTDALTQDKGAASGAKKAAEPSVVAGNRVDSILLSRVSKAESLRLTGVSNRRRVQFAEPVDALINGVDLNLVYTPSPSLIPKMSHIKIYLNGAVAAVIPIDSDDLGKTINKKLSLRAHSFSALNELDFEFVGHYTLECEDPFNTALWLEIAGESTLNLSLKPISLNDSLGMLPAPFINKRDFNSSVDVPFLLPPKVGNDEIKAAGILSSWFGVQAQWRKLNFSVLKNGLPAANAVILATNSNRPSFMADKKDYPDVEGPTLFVTSNPEQKNKKLLVLMGRESKDLIVAAQALALGDKSIGGSRVTIRSLGEIVPRKPYDAPNWVRSDRPTKLGELIGTPGELQVAGYAPGSIDVPVKMPPDLFTWRSRGVAMDLKYRYTPPIVESEARLRIGINDQLIKTINLTTSGEMNTNRLHVPFVDDMLFGEANNLFVPAFKLGAQNTLQFQFSTPVKKTGVCSEVIPENVRSMIDADSTIDFSEFDHYIQMPDLRAFVTGGFPYTKYADLSHTGIVVPKNAKPQEIQLVLQIVGQLGSMTGYPATGLHVLNDTDEKAMSSLDILAVGDLSAQGKLKSWSDGLPVKLAGGAIVDSTPKTWTQHIFNRLDMETPVNSAIASSQTEAGNGKIAIMQGGESPFAGGNSVIAISASNPDAYAMVVDGMSKSQEKIHGSVTYFHPEKIESALVGDTYYSGDLAWWKRIWYWLSQYPVTLALITFLSILALSILIISKLKNQEKKRLNSQG